MTSMLDTPTPSAERLVDLGDQEFSFSVSDFERVRKLIYERAGISLHEGKQAMVYSRFPAGCARPATRISRATCNGWSATTARPASANGRSSSTA